MEANEFIDLLENPEKAKEKGIDELKKLAKDYPYSQPIQLLYAIRLRKSSEHLFSQQLGRTSILTNDRSVLFDLFEQGHVEDKLAPEQYEDELKEHQNHMPLEEPQEDILEEEVEEVFVSREDENSEEIIEETAPTVDQALEIKAEAEEEEVPEESNEEFDESVLSEEAEDEEEEVVEEKPEKERNISALPADERIRAILEKNRQLREEFERKKQKGDSPLSEMDLRLKGIREKLDTLKKPKEEVKEDTPVSEVQEESTTDAVAQNDASTVEEIQDQQENKAESVKAEEVPEPPKTESEEEAQDSEAVLTPYDTTVAEEDDQTAYAEEDIPESTAEESTSEEEEKEEVSSTDELIGYVSEEEELTAESQEAFTSEEITPEAVSPDEETPAGEIVLDEETVFEVHANEIEQEEVDEVASELEAIDSEASEEVAEELTEEESIPFGLDEGEDHTSAETTAPALLQEDQQMSFGDWLKKLNKSGGSSLEKLEASKKELGITKTETASFEEKVQLLDSFVEKLPDLKKKKIEAGPTKTPIEIGELVNEGEVSLVTETLAKVYIQQKHYGKAIKAYEILKLKYPEKSSFFAARISEVKNLKNTK